MKGDYTLQWLNIFVMLAVFPIFPTYLKFFKYIYFFEISKKGLTYVNLTQLTF
jgi:hypothetical protein